MRRGAAADLEALQSHIEDSYARDSIPSVDSLVPDGLRPSVSFSPLACHPVESSSSVKWYTEVDVRPFTAAFGAVIPPSAIRIASVHGRARLAAHGSADSRRTAHGSPFPSAHSEVRTRAVRDVHPKITDDGNLDGTPHT